MKERKGVKPSHFNYMSDTGKSLRPLHMVAFLGFSEEHATVKQTVSPVHLLCQRCSWTTVKCHAGVVPADAILLMEYLFSDGVSSGNESFSLKKDKTPTLCWVLKCKDSGYHLRADRTASSQHRAAFWKKLWKRNPYTFYYILRATLGMTTPRGEDRQGLFLQVINTYCEAIGPLGLGRSLAKDRELRRLHRYDKHLTKIKPAKVDMTQEVSLRKQPLTNDLLAVGRCWRRKKKNTLSLRV